MDKIALTRAARHLAATRFPDIADFTSHCLLLNACLVTAARAVGHRLLLQAGSAFWPRTTAETDDGEEPNRFGYEFEWTSLTHDRMQAGMLPEMHVWAADPATREIIDMTSGDFPAQCQRLVGLGWKAPPPPACFWGRAAELPALASYAVSAHATFIAGALLQQALEDDA